MNIHPGVIALLVASACVSAMLLWAAWFSVGLLRRWDLSSSGEGQLELERRTYLVSTLVGYALMMELGTLVLYVYTAEDLHGLFVGAMCAAGTLNVGQFGYATLGIKLGSFLACSMWLVLNYLDAQAPDYPLTKIKYALMLLIAPLVLAEAVLGAMYLLGLKADVITSCCGTLFSSAQGEVEATPHAAAALDAWVALANVLYIASTLWYILVTKRGWWALGLGAMAATAAGLWGATYIISPYLYELPTHNCPFCMLKAEYHYIGYALYAALLGAGAAGLGAAVAGAVRDVGSLRETAPRAGKMLAVLSLVLMGLFYMLSAYIVAASNLKM